jgi:hypothetical protein
MRSPINIVIRIVKKTYKAIKGKTNDSNIRDNNLKTTRVINNATHMHNGWDNACTVFEKISIEKVDLRVFFDKDIDFRYDKSLKNKDIFDDDFIGFIHVPLSVGTFDKNKGNPFHPEILSVIKDKCKGFFFLTENETKKYSDYFEKNGINITCESLIHPMQDLSLKFSWEKFTQNNTKSLIQSGRFGRKLYSIFNLNVPTQYQKKIVPTNKRTKINLTKEKENGEYENLDYNSVELIPELPYSEYLKVYEDSIIYLELYDVVACNAIVDCIATNCPIILNRLPGAEEYLGKDYPLFYESTNEVYAMLENMDLIKDAHEYLKEMDKTKFKLESFKDSFLKSEIYNSIK